MLKKQQPSFSLTQDLSKVKKPPRLRVASPTNATINLASFTGNNTTKAESTKTLC